MCPRSQSELATKHIAGRANAFAIMKGRVDATINWKSDVNPTPTVREAHVQQLRDYLSATGAERGASGEVTWIQRRTH